MKHRYRNHNILLTSIIVYALLDARLIGQDFIGVYACVSGLSHRCVGNRLHAAEVETQVERLYAPKVEDFKESYDSDALNQKRQTRDDYYNWVKIFYAGNFGTEGWTRQAQRLVGKIKNNKTANEATKKLNELGRKLSQEWSKDNGVRRIDTNDLAVFGRQLGQAMSKDNGNGAKILEAIEAIDKAATKKLDSKSNRSF